ILKQVGEQFVLQFGMRWQDALEFARMVIGAARAAEEYANANQQIAQEALLIRTGAPFSLVTDSKMREAARTEAQYGAARKQMPLLGVPSSRAVGSPTITKQRKT
ncbi:MAG TPA: hypothetical protein VFN67_02280, partial [Polyangiales bacterium]|nr:hypothetical protein [Polyangiales bacterium]